MNAILPPPILNSQDRAYLHLKDSIINLAFNPGQKLTAQDVALKLGMSRTPVREAFSKLAQEGLVIRQGGWGYVVSPLTFNDAMHIFRMRELLEAEAIREAVPKLNSERLALLDAHLQHAEDLLRRGKTDAYRLSTRAFYKAIAETTENSILEYMLSLIDDRVRWVGAMITHKHDDRPKQSLSENKRILQALKARDEEAAVAGVRRHVSGARDSFLRYVTQDPAFFHRG